MPRAAARRRVARRPRHVADDQPLFAQQPIDQRRLADVRTADDRDRDLRRGSASARPVSRPRRQPLARPRRADRPSLRRARRQSRRPARSRADRTRARGLRARLSSVLLTATSTGTFAPAQLAGDLLVAGDQPFAAVDHEHEEIGRLERRLALLRRRARAADPRSRRTPPVSTSLNGVPCHVDGLGNDVAGRAGDRRDDRAPRAGDPVEQRGLADVRPADQHDGRASAGRLWAIAELKLAPILTA